MVPVNGFSVLSKSGNHLVCGLYKTKKYFNLFPRKVILFSQPNDTDLGQFMKPSGKGTFFSNLAYSFETDIYAFDYSGYGRSTGTATENNIYLDIESVFEEIIRREGDEIQVLLSFIYDYIYLVLLDCTYGLFSWNCSCS